MMSIFKVYLIWSVVLLIQASWSTLTNTVIKEAINDEAYPAFLFFFYLSFLIFFSIGALLSWLSGKGKSWALWLFTAYCLYHSVDSVWGIAVSNDMEIVSVDAFDWLKGYVIAGVWLFLAGYAWYSRPKPLLQQTHKSGTVEL